jgi:hypothetical protein
VQAASLLTVANTVALCQECLSLEAAGVLRFVSRQVSLHQAFARSLERSRVSRQSLA